MQDLPMLPFGVSDFTKIISNNLLYVDKTDLVYKLASQFAPIVLSRPRRFGKTVAANMIAAYFGKGRDSREIFSELAISGQEHFEYHLNQHNVIYITFNEMPRNCINYQMYIERIQSRLLRDLMREFPDADIHEEDALWDAFNNIY